MAFRSYRATLNGVGIRWLEWGRPAAPTLLCVHGSFGVAESFTSFAARASSTYRIVAPDLRGHGGSDWVEGADAYAPTQVAGDIAALVAHLGLASFHLVGLSLGGLVCCEYAGKHLDPVRSVTLVDIAPEVDAKVRAGLRSGPQYPASFASLDAAVAWADADGLWTQGPMLRNDLATRLVQQADGSFAWRTDQRFFTPAGRARWLDDAARFWSGLERVSAPVLLMRAGRSPLLNDAIVASFSSRVKDAKVVTLPAAQHSIPISDPDDFSNTLFGFLAEADGRR